jgi:hypothetical protein
MDAPADGGAFGRARFVRVGASYVNVKCDVPIEFALSANKRTDLPVPYGDDWHTKLVSLIQVPRLPPDPRQMFAAVS